MVNKFKPLLLIVWCASLLCMPAGTVEAADNATNGPRKIDSSDFTAFVDGMFQAQMRAFHIPGAAFSAVYDGKILMAKGYGMADLAGDKPARANLTLFRVGSVSKLVVWTAVMQLAERGLIDLDADVNEYLVGFSIPEAFGKPVTMAMLMSHTPGFEDRAMGLMKEKAEDMAPLERHLAEHMPARVFPPGEVTSYSNYGASLAGYVVGRVSGLGFDRYVEENIFAPLGMNHSTFRQPPPPDLARDLAVGYKYDAGRYLPKPFEYIQDAPAGAMSSTAWDMALFMLAHVNRGSLGGGRILAEDTARRMHERLFGNADNLAGMAHGFYEATVAGRRMIMHEGDTIWFHTLLAIDPETGFGLFVSYNAEGGTEARRDLLKAVAERFLSGPSHGAASSPVMDLEPPLSAFAGWYALNRASRTTIEKIMVMANQRRVSPEANGTLVTSGLFSDRSMRWNRTGPFEFASADGEDLAVFRPLPDGGMRLMLDSLPILALERQPWYATTPFSISLVALCTLVFMVAVVAWPVSALGGRSRTIFYKGKPTFRSGKVLGWLTCALYLVFMGMAVGVAGDPKIIYGVTGALKRLLYLPLAGGALTLLTAAACLWAWFKPRYTLGGRLFHTLVLAAAVIFTWFLYYWNLLGFNY